jgi:hypothetical protein
VLAAAPPVPPPPQAVNAEAHATVRAAAPVTNTKEEILWLM